jgi:hypothetical protein
MHIHEDRLIEYALDIPEDEHMRREIETHLETCPECLAKLTKLKSDIDVLGSLRPRRPDVRVPRIPRRQAITYGLLRAAALIIFGLAVGAGGFAWLREEPVRVTPQYLTLSTPADSLARYAASDATDVSNLHRAEVNRVAR